MEFSEWLKLVKHADIDFEFDDVTYIDSLYDEYTDFKMLNTH